MGKVGGSNVATPPASAVLDAENLYLRHWNMKCEGRGAASLPEEEVGFDEDVHNGTSFAAPQSGAGTTCTISASAIAVTSVYPTQQRILTDQCVESHMRQCSSMRTGSAMSAAVPTALS